MKPILNTLYSFYPKENALYSGSLYGMLTGLKEVYQLPFGDLNQAVLQRYEQHIPCNGELVCFCGNGVELLMNISRVLGTDVIDIGKSYATGAGSWHVSFTKSPNKNTLDKLEGVYNNEQEVKQEEKGVQQGAASGTQGKKNKENEHDEESKSGVSSFAGDQTEPTGVVEKKTRAKRQPRKAASEA